MNYQDDCLSRAISLLCGAHAGEPGFFDRFRSLAKRFDGVEEVAMVAVGETDGTVRPSNVFTTAPLRVAEEVVGELRVYIRVGAFRESTPLPLTRFLARQLEAALRGSAIHVSHSMLRDELAKLQNEVLEDKLFERARGIIESQRLIPAGQGARLLRKVSHQSGKNMRQLAKGILAAAEKNPWRFRKEFYA